MLRIVPGNNNLLITSCWNLKKKKGRKESGNNISEGKKGRKEGGLVSITFPPLTSPWEAFHQLSRWAFSSSYGDCQVSWPLLQSSSYFLQKLNISWMLYSSSLQCQHRVLPVLHSWIIAVQNVEEGVRKQFPFRIRLCVMLATISSEAPLEQEATYCPIESMDSLRRLKPFCSNSKLFD